MTYLAVSAGTNPVVSGAAGCAAGRAGVPDNLPNAVYPTSHWRQRLMLTGPSEVLLTVSDGLRPALWVERELQNPPLAFAVRGNRSYFRSAPRTL